MTTWIKGRKRPGGREVEVEYAKPLYAMYSGSEDITHGELVNFPLAFVFGDDLLDVSTPAESIFKVAGKYVMAFVFGTVDSVAWIPQATVMSSVTDGPISALLATPAMEADPPGNPISLPLIAPVGVGDLFVVRGFNTDAAQDSTFFATCHLLCFSS